MKSLLFVYFIIMNSLSFALNSSANAENGWPSCPANGTRVSVLMESSLGDLRYHENFNSSQLSNLRGNSGHSLGPNWVPTGLTVADENYHLKTNAQIYYLGQGRFCAVLESAELFIGYRNIDVYISNKYNRNTCEYDSILSHENVHVQIFRDTLYRHASSIERKIKSVAPKIGPVYLRSADAAANKIQRLLDAQVRPLFRRMSDEITRKNSRIDTAANYRREQALCSNW